MTSVFNEQMYTTVQTMQLHRGFQVQDGENSTCNIEGCYENVMLYLMHNGNSVNSND